MDDESLKERIVGLTDEELLKIVAAPKGEYRQAAVDFAKAEMKWRQIDFAEPAAEEDPVDPLLEERRPETPAGVVCAFCGGKLRSATLIAEKELTIVFTDTKEERFLRVHACAECGQVSFAVDYDEDVKP